MRQSDIKMSGHVDCWNCEKSMWVEKAGPMKCPHCGALHFMSDEDERKGVEKFGDEREV